MRDEMDVNEILRTGIVDCIKLLNGRSHIFEVPDAVVITSYCLVEKGRLDPCKWTIR